MRDRRNSYVAAATVYVGARFGVVHPPEPRVRRAANCSRGQLARHEHLARRQFAIAMAQWRCGQAEANYWRTILQTRPLPIMYNSPCPSRPSDAVNGTETPLHNR